MDDQRARIWGPGHVIYTVLGPGYKDLGTGACNLLGLGTGYEDLGPGVVICTVFGQQCEDWGLGNVILGQRQRKLRYLKVKQRSVGCAARKLPERASARNIRKCEGVEGEGGVGREEGGGEKGV